ARWIKPFVLLMSRNGRLRHFTRCPLLKFNQKDVVYCVPNVVEMHGLDGLVMEMMHRIFVPITRKTAH
ncbi:hypothetical protein CFK47_19535, partial [Escherichia coli O157]